MSTWLPPIIFSALWLTFFIVVEVDHFKQMMRITSQQAEEREKLYRLIKAETLTDYTSNVSTELPKGRSPILENLRRGLGMERED